MVTGEQMDTTGQEWTCFAWWLLLKWNSVKTDKGGPERYGGPNGAGHGPGEPVAPKEDAKGRSAWSSTLMLRLGYNCSGEQQLPLEENTHRLELASPAELSLAPQLVIQIQPSTLP
jgi:hypothetical protein